MHPQPHAIHLKTALTDLSGSVGAFVLNCRNYVRVKHCRLCDDEGWVCEAHPEQTWEGPHACTCDAAGAPCQACNKPVQTSRHGCRKALSQTAVE
jgi:hypothetical protein